jgi:hypothetical protein
MILMRKWRISPGIPRSSVLATTHHCIGILPAFIMVAGYLVDLDSLGCLSSRQQTTDNLKNNQTNPIKDMTYRHSQIISKLTIERNSTVKTILRF